MSLYETLLFVHVTAAVVWVGGVVMHLSLVQLSRRSGTPEQEVVLVRWDDKLSSLLYVPASLAVLGAGIGLVLEGNWDWGQAWIVLGLTIFAVVFALGLGFYLPQGRRLEAAIEAGGLGSLEAQAIARRIQAVTWLDLLLLAAAVFVMTTKPGL